MLSQSGKKVDVTVDDQNNINKFSKLNIRMHELEASKRAKQKLLEDLEDASNELMLSDEESIRYVIGECFVSLDKDAAEERLQDMSTTINKDVQQLDLDLEKVKEQMKELKAALYGKFGNSINLEE